MKLEDSIVYGGILGQILTLPLDYIKTQHQIYNKSPQSRLVKFIGFETVLLKLFSSSYIKMFLYTNLGHESIINLSLANIAITSFLTPLDHILTKLQTKYLNSELKLKNFYDCSKYIYRQYGLSGFYIGVIPNFLKNLTFSIASALNNRPMLTSHSLPWDSWIIFAMTYVASYPFDTLRTHMQKITIGHYKNMWSCFQEIYSNKGLLGFYHGIHYGLIRHLVVLKISLIFYKNFL